MVRESTLWNKMILPKTHDDFLQLVAAFKKLDIHAPGLYLVVCVAVALLGYLFIFAFPAFFFYSIYRVFELLPFYPVSESATQILLWISLSIFFGHICYHIVSIDFTTIPGLKIKNKSADLLFSLLDETHLQYPQPEIDEIIVTDRFELGLVKTPRYGVPIFSGNTLVIGLPLMLTISPKQLRCLFIRKIIQYSKRRRVLHNWLNQLRDSWSRYCVALSGRTCIGHQILYWFFSLYSPIFNTITLPVRIWDELASDRNALDLVNSDELLDTFQACLIANLYLEKRFWPQVLKNLNNQTTSKHIRLFAHLAKDAKYALSKSDTKDWLEKIYLSRDWNFDNAPPIIQRMENLGVSSAKLPCDLKQNAAEYYFRNNLYKIITMTDQNWVKTYFAFTHAQNTTIKTKKEPRHQKSTNKNTLRHLY